MFQGFRLPFVGFVVFTLYFTPPAALACSAFASPGNSKVMMGKSYDWSLSHGMLTVNKKNVKKESLLLKATDRKATWTSKYGSITFNQYGREMPLGGMNEKGLAIEILWLNSTSYPLADNRPSLNEAQWIQYFLDNYQDVGEMIDDADKVRPSTLFAEVHYLACDKSGDCATFEFLEEKLVVHGPSAMPVKTLTNSEYESSLDELEKYQGFGGTKKIPMQGYGSDLRFVRLSHLQKEFTDITDHEERHEHAFAMLDSVESPTGYSKWHIVYDLTKLEIHYRRLDLDRAQIKTIPLKDFNFNCARPVKTFDMDQEAQGNISAKFVDYSKVLNDEIIRTSAEHHNVPEDLRLKIQNYPSTTKCTEWFSWL